MESPSDIPVYARIKRELKTQIEVGELAEGALVPSEFELALRYGVSRTPTRQALRDLEQDGYITRVRGRGSYVAPRGQRKRVSTWGARTFAVACPHLECRYTRDVVEGFVQRAAADSYHTMVYFLRFSDASEYEFLADVRNSGIEGLAIWLQHTSERTRDLLRGFQQATYPIVLIDRHVPGLDTDYVVTDNHDVGYQLTRALIAKGHRSIGYMACDAGSSSCQARLDGYRNALNETALPCHDEHGGVFESEGASPQSVVQRIMARSDRPTAFFCINNGVAEILVDELRLLGYRLPDQVDLAVVDDNRFADALGLPIVTAEQMGYEMGRQSAELLLARVANPFLEPQRRSLRAEVLIGRSAAAARAVSRAQGS